MKVDVHGGPPETIFQSPLLSIAGAWNRAGDILFSTLGGGKGLLRVSAAGGPITELTRLDPSRQETYHPMPRFLPDGRHFLYLRLSSSVENSGIYVGSLDLKPDQQPSKKILTTNAGAIYVPSGKPHVGQLLFLREDTLMRQRFDAEKMELLGDPVPVAEQVGR